MVEPVTRRSDDDLGPLTDRTGLVEGRAVTTSSCCVRGRHSTLDILSTFAPIGPDPTQYFSKTQIPLNEVSDPGLQLGAQFFEQLARSVQVDSSYNSAEYGATACGNPSSDAGLVMSKITGSRQKRPEKSHPPTNPMQRKKSKNGGWEQTGPADGGPQDLVLVPSYSDHVAGSIWRGQDRGILKSRSHCVSLTSWTPSDPTVVQLDLAAVAESPRSGLSTEQRATCYVLYLPDSSLFTYKSENNVPGKLWPLVKNIYLYFPMFPPPVRPRATLCKLHIQRFAILGHKTENKLLDLLIHLDTMTANKARQTP
ncbi:hypothetical protein M9H77_02368 [Catharanthus roseus]|uniref:Uncharacterized protein n=1 Tax=Catharanthus roseus TaxID=4058 RepID=A0ACC0C895_CATRO|nr:hypothetical protein M9H77_02368 [Catharanthus roseus]